MKKIAIIKTGSTLPEICREFNDFEHWIAAGLDVDPAMIDVHDAVVRFDLPGPDRISGAVIAGSHAMVTDDLDWSVNIASWIPEMVDAGTPLLGICYGHQLIARAMGGTVDYHPGGMELGTVDIRLDDRCRQDPLFTGIPRQIPVHVSHSQSAIVLPAGAGILAAGDYEPHHAFRIGRAAWGVQFHPEYDEAVMAAYITRTIQMRPEMAHKKEALLNAVRPTPHAAEVLARFGRLCLTAG